jgi:heat-inducible transcriptional repressor
MTMPLTHRQQDVLAAVVLDYVLTGSPVGSRTVSKNSPNRLSPATIRNAMADLEEMGFLYQPHTSAGRVPTDLGYRYYVDTLMSRRPLSPEEVRQIHATLPQEAGPGNLDELLGRTAKLLAGLSSHVGVVLTPRFPRAILKRLEFLRLSEDRILALFVSMSGMVDHRVIQVSEPYGDEDLISVTNLVNDNFQGLTLPQIREKVLAMMSAEKALYHRLLARALELSRNYLDQRDDDENEVLLDGTSNVLGEPTLADDVDRMKSLFQAFEDKGRLVTLLNACLDQDKARVLIGSECDDPHFTHLTLISSPYSYRQQPVGAVGVLGPRRMDYERLITLVDSLSRFLTEALARRAPEGGPLQCRTGPDIIEPEGSHDR